MLQWSGFIATHTNVLIATNTKSLVYSELPILLGRVEDHLPHQWCYYFNTLVQGLLIIINDFH